MPKTEYLFVDGTKTEVEIDEVLASVLADLAHKEELNNRKETRRHRSLFMLLELGVDFADKSVDVLSEVERNETMKRLHNAISKLSFEQQELLCRIYYHEEKMVDIAAEVGVDSSSIRHRLHRALKKLKKYLD